MTIKRFNSKTIFEDLTSASQEMSSDASVKAKQLGLQYVGFGRYEDPRTGQVTHIVQNDKLVPFGKAVKTNSYQTQSGNDLGNFAKEIKKQAGDTASQLVASYPPEKYDDSELDAIKYYTGGNAAAINQSLLALPPGISGEEISPTGADDNTPQIVTSLDSALDKSKAPVNLLTYVSLGGGYSSDDFKPGSSLLFKGYRSTTLDFAALMQTPQNMTVLQILVPKGAKGMYVDDYSASPGESEFLLPRGTQLTITAGPTKLKGSIANSPTEVTYFTAELNK